MSQNLTQPIEPKVLEESNALMVIERAEIDTQIATAHKYPRSLEVFKRRALEMVSIDEETAASCIYKRPVGKDSETGTQKVVEGESIRLAEIVAACYGNCRSGAQIIEMTPRYVKARGFAHDLEINNANSSEVVESTVDKYGKPYSERQRAVVAKVALAKAQRDAIFKIIPKALCRPIREQARKVAIGNAETLNVRRQKALDWVKSLVVNGKPLDMARVFGILGVKGASDIGLDQLETLTGLRTAVRDEGMSIDEAFPQIQNQVQEDDFGKSKTESLANKMKSKEEQRQPGE